MVIKFLFYDQNSLETVWSKYSIGRTAEFKKINIYDHGTSMLHANCELIPTIYI